MWLEGKTKEAMRLGDWKLVRNAAGAHFELYNIKTDPGEKENLAAKEPQRVSEMAQALESHMKAAQRVPWNKEGEMPARSGRRKGSGNKK